jgi:hypothetical protein
MIDPAETRPELETIRLETTETAETPEAEIADLNDAIKIGTVLAETDGTGTSAGPETAETDLETATALETMTAETAIGTAGTAPPGPAAAPRSIGTTGNSHTLTPRTASHAQLLVAPTTAHDPLPGTAAPADRTRTLCLTERESPCYGAYFQNI